MKTFKDRFIIESQQDVADKHLEAVKKFFDTVSSVSYTGNGDVEVKGKGKRKEPYNISAGNAQLAGVIAKTIAKEYKLKEPKMVPVNESNVTRGNWDNLKVFFRKQKGYKSWEFEGDYEVLKIGFDTGLNASHAVKASNASNLEINAFGDVSVEGKVVTVELNKDAMNALNVNENTESIITEGLFGSMVSMFSVAGKIKDIGKNTAVEIEKSTKELVKDKTPENMEKIVDAVVGGIQKSIQDVKLVVMKSDMDLDLKMTMISSFSKSVSGDEAITKLTSRLKDIDAPDEVIKRFVDGMKKIK